MGAQTQAGGRPKSARHPARLQRAGSAFAIVPALLRALRALTPPILQRALVRGVAATLRTLDRRHTRIARVNLDLAYGDTLSRREKKRILERSWEHLVHIVWQSLLNIGIDRDRLLENVEFENPRILQQAMESQRPIIFITAHYGNWELGTLAIAAAFDLPIAAVGRRLQWRWADRILQASRGQFGVRLIDKRGAMKPMSRVMRQKGALGLVVDQNTAEKDGILVSFFGREARHTPAAALLARKYDALVIPVFSRTEDYRRYTIRFHEPIPLEPSGEIAEEIRHHVQAQADVTEAVIREKPEEWLWIHRRWKNRYEEAYR